VETLRAALCAVEWPDDELAVYGTLKGPLFAIEDETLLRFRLAHGKLHPFRPQPAGMAPELAPVMEALTLLSELHRTRNRIPTAATVHRLLETTRAHAGFALLPAGHQVMAHIYRVSDHARAFEQNGGISFRGFVEELRRLAERTDTADGAVLEESADGVRIMTVHSAKGLEFPVVLLADMGANLASRDPERYLDPARGLCAMRLLRAAPCELLEHEEVERDRERAEGVRVAYVAATRARDLLIVPAVGQGPRDGWLEPLNKAIFPQPGQHRRRKQAKGCPAFFGGSTVLNPVDEMIEELVAPGVHQPRAGEHTVVWWDPLALRLDAPEQYGLRQEDLLRDAGEAAEGVQQYQQWREQRLERVTKAARPRYRILIPSETDEEPPQSVGSIRLESTGFSAPAAMGRRYGALVHRVLQWVQLGARRSQIEGAVKLHGSVLAATDEEIAVAARAVVTALQHPILEQARGALRVAREWPLVLPLNEETRLEGVIDLAFLSPEQQWTLVDFKTDAVIRAALPKYERQLRWYLYAVYRLTGQPGEAVLLGL
jgi:ATP-dependent helicase/nuclease subunit A